MKKTKGSKQVAAVTAGGPQSGCRSLSIEIDIESASSNFSSKQIKSSSPSSFDQDEEIKDILDAVETKNP